jgi:hypothetical protein
MARGKKEKSLMDRPAQRPDPWVGRELWATWRREAAPSQYAQRAFAVYNSAGHVSRQTYLEMMYDMEKDYPGRGWKEHTEELYAWYFKRNLALRMVPSFREVGEP